MSFAPGINGAEGVFEVTPRPERGDQQGLRRAAALGGLVRGSGGLHGTSRIQEGRVQDGEEGLDMLVFESIYTIGAAITFFLVLPELDAVKAAMFANCFCLGILGRDMDAEGNKAFTISLNRRIDDERPNEDDEDDQEDQEDPAAEKAEVVVAPMYE